MMNWNREVSKNLAHTKIGITDVRNTAERRRVRKAARRWARWQRDQLRTNEAVERVAVYMAHVTGEAAPGKSERTMARAAITALLGEG